MIKAFKSIGAGVLAFFCLGTDFEKTDDFSKGLSRSAPFSRSSSSSSSSAFPQGGQKAKGNKKSRSSKGEEERRLSSFNESQKKSPSKKEPSYLADLSSVPLLANSNPTFSQREKEENGQAANPLQSSRLQNRRENTVDLEPGERIKQNSLPAGVEGGQASTIVHNLTPDRAVQAPEALQEVLGKRPTKVSRALALPVHPSATSTSGTTSSTATVTSSSSTGVIPTPPIPPSVHVPKKPVIKIIVEIKARKEEARKKKEEEVRVAEEARKKKAENEAAAKKKADDEIAAKKKVNDEEEFLKEDASLTPVSKQIPVIVLTNPPQNRATSENSTHSDEETLGKPKESTQGNPIQPLHSMNEEEKDKKTEEAAQKAPEEEKNRLEKERPRKEVIADLITNLRAFKGSLAGLKVNLEKEGNSKNEPESKQESKVKVFINSFIENVKSFISDKDKDSVLVISGPKSSNIDSNIDTVEEAEKKLLINIEKQAQEINELIKDDNIKEHYLTLRQAFKNYKDIEKGFTEINPDYKSPLSDEVKEFVEREAEKPHEDIQEKEPKQKKNRPQKKKKHKLKNKTVSQEKSEKGDVEVGATEKDKLANTIGSNTILPTPSGEAIATQGGNPVPLTGNVPANDMSTDQDNNKPSLPHSEETLQKSVEDNKTEEEEEKRKILGDLQAKLASFSALLKSLELASAPLEAATEMKMKGKKKKTKQKKNKKAAKGPIIQGASNLDGENKQESPQNFEINAPKYVAALATRYQLLQKDKEKIKKLSSFEQEAFVELGKAIHALEVSFPTKIDGSYLPSLEEENKKEDTQVELTIKEEILKTKGSPNPLGTLPPTEGNPASTPGNTPANDTLTDQDNSKPSFPPSEEALQQEPGGDDDNKKGNRLSLSYLNFLDVVALDPKFIDSTDSVKLSAYTQSKQNHRSVFDIFPPEAISSGLDIKEDQTAVLISLEQPEQEDSPPSHAPKKPVDFAPVFKKLSSFAAFFTDMLAATKSEIKQLNKKTRKKEGAYSDENASLEKKIQTAEKALANYENQSSEFQGQINILKERPTQLEDLLENAWDCIHSSLDKIAKWINSEKVILTTRLEDISLEINNLQTDFFSFKDDLSKKITKNEQDIEAVQREEDLVLQKIKEIDQRLEEPRTQLHGLFFNRLETLFTDLEEKRKEAIEKVNLFNKLNTIQQPEEQLTNTVQTPANESQKADPQEIESAKENAFNAYSNFEESLKALSLIGTACLFDKDLSTLINSTWEEAQTILKERSIVPELIKGYLQLWKLDPAQDLAHIFPKDMLGLFTSLLENLNVLEKEKELVITNSQLVNLEKKCSRIKKLNQNITDKEEEVKSEILTLTSEESGLKTNLRSVDDHLDHLKTIRETAKSLQGVFDNTKCNGLISLIQSSISIFKSEEAETLTNRLKEVHSIINDINSNEEKITLLNAENNNVKEEHNKKEKEVKNLCYKSIQKQKTYEFDHKKLKDEIDLQEGNIILLNRYSSLNEEGLQEYESAKDNQVFEAKAQKILDAFKDGGELFPIASTYKAWLTAKEKGSSSKDDQESPKKSLINAYKAQKRSTKKTKSSGSLKRPKSFSKDNNNKRNSLRNSVNLSLSSHGSDHPEDPKDK